MEPKRALGRGLIKLRGDEPGESATRRFTAVANIILYLEKEGIPWDSEFTGYLNEVDGLANLISQLEALSEGRRIQAASVLAYITDSRELISEV